MSSGNDETDAKRPAKLLSSNWLFVPVIVVGAAIGLAISEQMPPLPFNVAFSPETKQVGRDYVPPVDIDIAGVPAILDGDLLEINGARIRLAGIDAPEPGQTCTIVGAESRCGQQASYALAGLIDERITACAAEGFDRHGRMLGVCTVGETEINAWLVRQGWALAAGTAGDAYRADEAAARAARAGVWEGEFVRPWDWRRGNREARISAALIDGDAAPEDTSPEGTSGKASADTADTTTPDGAPDDATRATARLPEIELPAMAGPVHETDVPVPQDPAPDGTAAAE